jgi:hypothetical protein
MKIAIHNPWNHEGSGELSSWASFCRAASFLGIEAKQVISSEEIDLFKPDFVVTGNELMPKLTKFPTYGICCASVDRMVSSYTHGILSVDSVFTCDGYLVASTSGNMYEFIHGFAYKTGKPVMKDFFYQSANIYYNNLGKTINTSLETFKAAELMYCGNNWDRRYLKLISALSKKEYFALYGAYDFNKKAYRGRLPYDNKSVIESYKKHGVGLVVQSAFYIYDNVVSNRVFEINSAGAVAICPRMPFYEEYYGDSVLYYEPFAEDEEMVEQIEKNLMWVRENPEEALQKALKAQQIFMEKLCLEALIPKLVEFHKQAVKHSGFLPYGISEVKAEFPENEYISKRNDLPEIGVIVRTGGRNLAELKRALESLLTQTYESVVPVIVVYEKTTELMGFLEEFAKKFKKFDVIFSDSAIHSKTLWCGLRHIKKVNYPLFGFLDDDDELFPNHFTTLIKTYLMNNAEVKWIYNTALIEGGVENKKKYGNLTDTRFLKKKHYFDVKDYAGFQAIMNNLSCLFDSSLLSKDLLDINVSISSAEDTLFWNKLICKTNPYINYYTTALIHRKNLFKYDNNTDAKRNYSLLMASIYEQEHSNSFNSLTSLYKVNVADLYPLYVQNKHDINYLQVKMKEFQNFRKIFCIVFSFQLLWIITLIILNIL